MLIINRLRIEIFTENGLYGFDEVFKTGLNIVRSRDNTRGKSSILGGIYYCLGLEEIIGGKGKKTLPSAYKQIVHDGTAEYNVLESKVYLEISNGEDIITLLRPIEMKGIDDRLITIYKSELENITNKEVYKVDTYVHMPNSAKNDKGFHKYINNFLMLDIPDVQATDGFYRPLYIQLIFSAFFIEQKNGWSGILSGIPYLGIKNAKSKVIEHILGLDIIENQKKRDKLKNIKKSIEEEWIQNILKLRIASKLAKIEVLNIVDRPKLLTELDLNQIRLMYEDVDIDVAISKIDSKLNEMKQKTLRNVDNFDELAEELKEIENVIEENNKIKNEIIDEKTNERFALESIENSLEIINNDIINNKDSLRLKKMGSEVESLVSKSKCPLCERDIDDTLLPIMDGLEIMSIDDNIVHLESQKELLLISKESHIKNILNIENALKEIRIKNYNLTRLAKYINSDLRSIENSLSQSEISKKIRYEEELENIEKFINEFDKSKETFKRLSSRWESYLTDESKLPNKYLSEKDISKINLLEKNFKRLLKEFGYESINVDSVKISHDNYMPLTEGFDMKFDSSASDNVRAIWSYTIALLKTSITMKGNHVKLVVLDEPAQQSMVSNDVNRLLNSLIELGNDKKSQSILAITAPDEDKENIISRFEDESYNEILIKGRAFNKIEQL